MTYRVSPIEIPADDPYQNDVLKRKETVEFLATLIERAGGPFVLSLDSPYGTGKSTLVGMLKAVLSQKNFQCVYFNAWQFDYAADPLVAMVSALDEITKRDQVKNAEFMAHMGKLRKLTTAVAKRTVVAGVKVATMGALDLEKEAEKIVTDVVGETTNDVIDAFQQMSGQLREFRQELEAAVKELPEAGKNATLVFFVDELDRCRPTFAIELLERVKHLFDVPNIAFVLSVDMRQLEASVAAVYGLGIDAPEYLRKFIDLEFGIPQVGTAPFTELMLTKFGLDDVFAARVGYEISADRSDFVSFFSKLAEVCKMSLRVQERSVARLKVVLDQTPSNHYLNPILVALLIVLHMRNRSLFSTIATGHSSPEDVVRYLRGMPAGDELMDDHAGIVIEAMLIGCDPNRDRGNAKRAHLQKMAESSDLEPSKRDRYVNLLEMTKHMHRRSGMSLPSIKTIAEKVDIAARIRD